MMDRLLTEPEMAKVLHYTPKSTIKFESTLTPRDLDAFKAEMRIELNAVAQAQDTKSVKAIFEKAGTMDRMMGETNVYMAFSWKAWQALKEDR